MFYKPKDTIPYLIQEEKYRKLFYKSKSSTSPSISKKNKNSKKSGSPTSQESQDNTSLSPNSNLSTVPSNQSIVSMNSNSGTNNDQKPPKLSKRSNKAIISETLKIVKEFEGEESLLWELKSVFFQVSSNKKKQGSVTPKRFIDILQKKNGK